MTVLRAHFDGRVIVPDEPMDLPEGSILEVQINSVRRPAPKRAPLAELAEMIDKLPAPEGTPTDGAAQHDHYLYGTPKRP
jgi:hypothetical protein